jgi:signal peptidase II
MIITNSGLKKYSLILVIGGALGNFYDRIFFGAVPDFIDFHINNFHWFIFNLADIFITLGILFMIVLEIFDKNNNEKN